MKNKILIVEDSRTQSMLLENILERHNYQVATVDNGKKALKWLADNEPLLVISDIVMPGMNGYELCRQIKSQTTTKDTPVILLTSLNGTEEVIEGLIAGSDSFITKPFDQDYLISHIEKTLEIQSGIIAEKKSFGVEINFEGKKRVIQVDQQQMIKLLLNIYEGAIQQNSLLQQTQEQLRLLNENLGCLVEERTFDLSEETRRNKQIAEKLRESEEKWRQLVTTIPDYIALHDTEAKFLFLNHFKEGYTEKETIGKSMYDFISPESNEIYRKNFENCLNTGQNQVFEHTVPGTGGVLLVYECTFIPVMIQGKVTNVMSIARDITERKRVENEINNNNQLLVKVNAEKDKFFSIIAHDLRSPLNSFLGFTEMMVEELPDLEFPQIQEMAVLMQKSASNLYRLIENLLQWAQAKRGIIPFNPKVMQFRSFVEESAELVMEAAKNKEIEISYDIPEEIMVLADSNMLQTVIRNLVLNAVKFTETGGKLCLSAESTDDQKVEIAIKDSGIGMSPAIVENLFRLDGQTNRKGTNGEPGTGLGLLLCKEFIEKHGGCIWAESEVGKGSTFYFTIPSFTPTHQTQKIFSGSARRRKENETNLLQN